jgi:hypothetical protein
MEELQRINPRPCELEPCDNTAHWQYGGIAICDEDMRFMANMNGDNEEVFGPALAQTSTQEA